MEYHFNIEKVVTDMSNEEYHSFGKEIISSSYLKGIFKHSIARAGIPLQESEALRFGSLFHEMMEIGNKKFEEVHAIIPEECSNKRTKAYKEFVEAYPDAITSEDFKKLSMMYYNIINNDFFSYNVSNYESHEEYSYFATCNNRKYRIRPDISFHHNDEIKSVFDYKTCQDVTTFKYDLNKYAYDLQAVFYSDVLGIDPENFYFIAVEKTYPYTAQVFGLSEQTMERGRSRLNTAISRIETQELGTGMEIIERI